MSTEPDTIAEARTIARDVGPSRAGDRIMSRDAIIVAVLALPQGEQGTFVRRLAQAAGWHPLCLLDEASVRAEVRALIETCEESAIVSADDVTDADIHAACIRVTAHIDLSEEYGLARFNAARAAIRMAEERRTGST